ncbi:MAG: SpoIID/LytB domain-containing protein [Candidatus Aminicenantaceae bacterium]
MKIPRIEYRKYYIIGIFVVLFLWGNPVEFGKENTFFHGYSIQKPIIRIGLGVNISDIKIQSSSGMKIYEVNSHYKLIADDVKAVNIRGRREKLSEKFIIQVAQTRTREEAELMAQDLRIRIGNNVYVTENKTKGIFLVKVGDFLTRGDALKFIKTLNQGGIKDTWILREEITEKTVKPFWILVNNELKSLSDDTVLYFIPSNKQSFLSYKGRDYRGIFVLRASRKGIVLVNILNIEDYLRGVVPSEFSPYSFNELEAHKAQAIAARTYAIKNLGTFEDLGYDLCDTPKSQFYKGMSAEHPLSNKAVELTRGEAIFYGGKLINALYTSTCGGMTENVEYVFEGQALPYLRSTECFYEKQKEWLVESMCSISPVRVGGENIGHHIAYLISLKVIPSKINSAFYEKEASFDEAVEWIENALILLGKKKKVFSREKSSLNFITFAHLVVGAFGWQERVENLLLKSEVTYMLKDFSELKEEDRNKLAYLVFASIFPDLHNIGSLDRTLTRAELAFYLAKVISSYRDFRNQGIFIGFNKNKIEFEKGNEERQVSLTSNVFLLRNNGGHYSFSSYFHLLRGEKVRWVEGDGEVKLLEIFSPFNSKTLDRHSVFQRWQHRESREKLERRINQYYPIGVLMDVIPQRRGLSKRVIELLIKGTESQVVVKGLKIRHVLGLRENLFVIDREYDEEGKTNYFMFSGRGWGHGVGLCQVGAFGMAQAGADYTEILKKYYHGIKIEKMY